MDGINCILPSSSSHEPIEKRGSSYKKKKGRTAYLEIEVESVRRSRSVDRDREKRLRRVCREVRSVE